MPSVRVHKQQAKHNNSFLNSINEPKYRDWRLTVAFYVALQAIDAGLTEKDPRWREKKESTLYALREKILAMWNINLHRHYNFLLIKSRESRYLENIGDKMASDYFTDEEVNRYIEKHLKPVLEQFHI